MWGLGCGVGAAAAAAAAAAAPASAVTTTATTTTTAGPIPHPPHPFSAGRRTHTVNRKPSLSPGTRERLGLGTDQLTCVPVNVTLTFPSIATPETNVPCRIV